MNGFINLLKAPGITSSTAVSLIKKTYGLKKVGHAGTLDPAAAGVLPIMLNRATRLFDYLQDEVKEYIAEFVFGADTDTLDMQGTVIERNDIEVSLGALTDIIPKFLGEIKQTPPKVSAISINGRKAYDLQRDNLDFEIPEREVTVSGIDIIRQTAHNSFLLKINCSKGTYIRSLCSDMADCLNTFGYVNYLLRTKSSGFNLEDAWSIEELREKPLDDVIVPIDRPIVHLPKIKLEDKYMMQIINGIAVPFTGEAEGVFRVYCDDKFMGLGRPEADNDIQYIKVFKRFFDEEEL